MRYVNWTKFTGDSLGISSEDVMRALAGYFLRSGFENGFAPWSGRDSEQSWEELREAVRDALESGDLFDPAQRDALYARLAEMPPEEVERLIENLLRRLAADGYAAAGSPGESAGAPVSAARGQTGSPKAEFRFELSSKGLDFLGYKAFKDLMGALGRSSFGNHDTREQAAGVETSGSSKPYEFGDILNLDIAGALSNAFRREVFAGMPANLEYADLMVYQSAYRSSCATVLMLDCSHSMILYGEDRFTPAKQVALALAHLLRTQFPGDTLDLVLFHDSAEHVPLPRLSRACIGPFHQHARGSGSGPEAVEPQPERHAADRNDYRRQTVGDHFARRAHLQKPVRPRPAGDRANAGRSPTVQAPGHCDPHVHAGAGLRLGAVHPKDHRNLPRQGLFTTPYTLGRYLLADYMNRKTRMAH